MNTNYESIQVTTSGLLVDGELVEVLDLLAASGIAAEMIHDGDADGCPHCASQVLSEAA
jgi:hypothetical protein